MKSPPLKSLLYLLLLTVSVSCFSQSDSLIKLKYITVPSPELNQIFGKWEWVKSSGGYTGKTTTPASSGHTKTLEFCKEGRMKEFKDGKLVNELRFSFEECRCIHGRGTVYCVVFNKAYRLSIQFEGQNVLHLDAEAHDGIGSIYNRIQK